MEPLAIAVVVAVLLAALAAVYVIARQGAAIDAGRDLHAASAARALEVRAERDRVAGELAELRAALERRPLEGETVIVNTPKPDDQSIRGVVVRELEPRGLVLAGAVYLDRGVDRGRETVREVPAGDVVVPVYAFAQIIRPAE